VRASNLVVLPATLARRAIGDLAGSLFLREMRPYALSERQGETIHDAGLFRTQLGER
jgi:hypothetical protein